MNKTSPRSDVSTALSYVDYESSVVDVSLVPLGMKATHDPTGTLDNPWLRWKSLEEATIVRLMSILKHHKEAKITL